MYTLDEDRTRRQISFKDNEVTLLYKVLYQSLPELEADNNKHTFAG